MTTRIYIIFILRPLCVFDYEFDISKYMYLNGEYIRIAKRSTKYNILIDRTKENTLSHKIDIN